MDPVKVILNPYSGRGAGAKTAERIRNVLNQADVPFEMVETTARGHAIELARQAVENGFKTVVAAGGDGTVSEVVNGMAQATSQDDVVGTLGVLPIGSGNDFADMAGCPRNLLHAAQLFRSGRTRRVDLCHAVIHAQDQQIQRYFGNNFGVGFEAQVTVESYRIQRLRGFAIYLLAVLRSLKNYEQPQFDVTWIDETGQQQHVNQRSLMVSLGNSRRTGGGFYVTPDAVMDDGLIDMGIAKALSTVRILILLPQVMAGAHRNNPAIRLVRCSQVHIETTAPVPVHADGEVLTEQAREIDVIIQPLRLQVLAQT